MHSPSERRREAAVAGHRGDSVTARSFLADPDPAVRETALGALARSGGLIADHLVEAAGDPAPRVRRRAGELAGTFDWDAVGPNHPGQRLLCGLLGDDDPSVVEAAAWASGERHPAEDGAIEGLARVAADHPDVLCREAAVAALGARRDQAGLAAIIAAMRDKPAVRRRAVIALAPFDGPQVHAALERALDDRDRQVRQVAEDLLGDRLGTLEAGAIDDSDDPDVPR